jgi:hypothetical protein
MATGTRASNYKARVNKWKPYLNKPFYLGATQGGDAGEDGGNYVYGGRTVGSPPPMKAYIDDELNDSFCYRVNFVVGSGLSAFYIEKYNSVTNAISQESIVDTIYASTTLGHGRYWEVTDTTAGSSSRGAWVTIDVGIHIQIEGDVSDYDDDDYYIIRTPDLVRGMTLIYAFGGTEENRPGTMRRRRVYFGGYHSYLQLPPTEGDAFHSDIIPSSLEGKSITCLFGKVFSNDSLASASWQDTLRGIFSKADKIGNSAVSLYLEWSSDKDAATSSTAGGTTYSWGTNENWLLGTLLVNDIDPSQTATPEDRTSYATAPAIDVDASVHNTGTLQILNVATFGRAGYARIKTSYDTGTGDPTMQAHNQFWPCTLLIN